MIMKPLPDIGVSTAFWASVATLWSAAGAWFTYVGAAKLSRLQTYDEIMNLLSGLEAELDLVRDWASGGEEEIGYSQSKTKEELVKERRDWFNPSRQIFTFETPSLKAVTSSAQLHNIAALVRPLVYLNYSIRRLFDSHLDYRQFVHSSPHLYQSVVAKLSEPKNTYTGEEKTYMNHVFGMNMKMHQELIGGKDSADLLCLYHSFRTAQSAIKEFKSKLRPEPLPQWYWVLHVIAFYLAANGFWQVLRWFDLL
jgi:hypothetical protein